MSAREFLDRLEEQGLLDESVIADLRAQLEGATSRVTAESLAKLLVDNGHLTKFQATRLINDVTAKAEERRTAKAESAEARRSQVESAEQKKGMGDDELGFAPLPEDKQKKSSRPETPAAAKPAEPAKPNRGSTVRNDRSTAADLLGMSVDEPASRPAKKAAPASPKAEAPLEELTPADEIKTNEGLTPLDEGLTPLDEASASPQPMASLDSGPLDMHDLGSASVPAPPPAAMLRKKTMPANPWDSKLIIAGTTSLVLLAILCVVLYLSLWRGTAAEVFQAAEEDYRGGSYANAVAKYDKFLDSYPSDPNAPLARVRRQMAQLRIEAEGARDPDRALEAAKRILPIIENEEEFSKAREELATLLPDIARSFANRARGATDAEQAEKLLVSLDEAMLLVNNPNYIPTTLRRTQTTVIESINETKEQVLFEINRSRELGSALRSMQSAIAGNDTREAFRVRDELLKKYPGLESREEVVQVVAAIAERERDLVVVQEQEIPASTEVLQDTGNKVVLYSRSGSGVPDAGADQTTFVLVHGAVYALDSVSGKVLWRKFVGYDATYTPKLFADTAAPEALIADAAGHHLLRVNARTGDILWRQDIGEPFFDPVMWRDRVLVSTASGRVLNIDGASGVSRRQTDLKQAVAGPVGVHDKFSVCYQVGENDMLYALSIDSMECREVFYLGHRKGTVNVPPSVAVGHVFVAVNSAPEFCYVHAMTLDGNGLSLSRVEGGPMRLDGHVMQSPAVAGRRLVYTTTLGAVVPLDINPQQNPPISQEIAALPKSRNTPLIPYAMIDQAALWLADVRLTAYDIQASQAQLVRNWAAFDGETFVGPLQRVASGIMHMRNVPGSQGFRACTVDGASGKNLLWQADLAFPTIRLVPQNGDRVLAISALGVAYQLDSNSVTSGIVEGSGGSQTGNATFQSTVSLPDGRIVIFSRDAQILFVDPARNLNELRSLRLNIAPGTAITEPILVAGGLLVPTVDGQIALLNIDSGDHLVLPFQPQRQAGSTVQWRQPAVLDSEGREFVVADDRQNLFRVGIVDTGGAHLAALEQVALDESIASPLAVLEGSVFGVVRRSDGDALMTFSLPRLKAEEVVPMKGRVEWGPQRVGNLVLLATADQLHALNAQRQVVWTAELSHGPLAGTPWPVDDSLILASRSGVLSRIAMADGVESARHDVGEPLGGGPVQSGGNLWVPGADGTLYLAPIPTAQ